MHHGLFWSLNIYILYLQAQIIAQIVVLGAQVVGRAFTRALRQEISGIVYGESQTFHFTFATDF